jgi:hypothetical protein
MKRTLLCLLAVAMSACTTTDVIVQRAPTCPVPAALLAACLAPVALEDGITYGGLVLKHQADRRSLETCSSDHRELIRLVGECNSVLDKYNSGLHR